MISVDEYIKLTESGGGTDEELQWWALFCVAVAGKSSDQTKAALRTFFELCDLNINPESALARSPLHVIDVMDKVGALIPNMQLARIGQYDRISRAWIELARHDARWLRECSVEELEAIHGIGPKTARFFLMSTRPGVSHAALDTHILAWLRNQGVEAPKATPSGKEYQRLEKIFLDLAASLNVAPAELDYTIWLQGYNKRKGQGKQR